MERKLESKSSSSSRRAHSAPGQFPPEKVVNAAGREGRSAEGGQSKGSWREGRAAEERRGEVGRGGGGM
eukprot:767187-Hanusia_phi.AAC.4